MTNVSSWSTTAASNNSASPDGAPEGMAPSGVNDTIREKMAAVARLYAQLDGSLTTAGSANTYTLTTPSTHTALADIGIVFAEINVTNTGATTLNVDTLGATSVVKADGTALAAGDLTAAGIYGFIYESDNDRFILIGGAGGLDIDGLTAETTIDTDTDTIAVYDDSASANRKFTPDDLATKVVAGHIHGLTCSQDTDTDHDVNITAGFCVDTAGVQLIRLGTEITKQIDASWTVGDDAGGLDTGTVTTDTIYYIWIIRRSDTGVVDALFSTSSTWSGVTKPTNYDEGQLIGAVVTDGSSNIIDFVQSGDIFWITATDPITDINDTSLTSLTFETGTVSVPVNCFGYFGGQFVNTSATSTFGYFLFAHADTASPSTSNHRVIGIQTAGAFDRVYAYVGQMVNGSSQLKYAAAWTGGSGEQVVVATRGWMMLTRGTMQS